jgi:hypothetical protein
MVLLDTKLEVIPFFVARAVDCILCIKAVEKASEITRSGPDGMRNPGTSIPYLIHAGSFSSGVKRTFWDVHNPDNAISIRIKDAMFGYSRDRFDQVIVEVANPTDTINEIERALARSFNTK